MTIKGAMTQARNMPSCADVLCGLSWVLRKGNSDVAQTQKHQVQQEYSNFMKILNFFYFFILYFTLIIKVMVNAGAVHAF